MLPQGEYLVDIGHSPCFRHHGDNERNHHGGNHPSRSREVAALNLTNNSASGNRPKTTTHLGTEEGPPRRPNFDRGVCPLVRCCNAVRVVGDMVSLHINGEIVSVFKSLEWNQGIPSQRLSD